MYHCVEIRTGKIYASSRDRQLILSAYYFLNDIGILCRLVKE